MLADGQIESGNIPLMRGVRGVMLILTNDVP